MISRISKFIMNEAVKEAKQYGSVSPYMIAPLLMTFFGFKDIQQAEARVYQTFHKWSNLWGLEKFSDQDGKGLLGLWKIRKPDTTHPTQESKR